MPRPRWIAALFAVLTLVLGPCVVATAEEVPAPELPTSVDELFELFDVAAVAADFVVVVDTSASMSAGSDPQYPRVREAYLAFVDAIPDGDNLSVVTFDTDPRVSFDETIGSDNRDEARSALPAEATGDMTDIGAALEATLRRLDRAGSHQNQTVIFLTDGTHEPPSGSTYPTTSGSAWDALRAEAQAVDSVHDVLVLAVALGARGSVGVELVRSVFGSPEINALPSSQLPDFFRESVRRSQLARLRTLVDQEVARGVAVASGEAAHLASTMTMDFEISSALEHLPVDVTIASVTATDDDGGSVRVRLDSPATIRLEPGGAATITIELRPPVPSASWFRVPEVSETARYDVAVEATYQVLPADLLARVTASPTSGAVTGTPTVVASRSYGLSVRDVLLFLAAVTLALLVAALVYRRFLWLPDLVGVFVLEERDAVAPERREIPLKGKRRMITGKHIPGAGAAKIEVFTRRGRPKRVYARVEAPPFVVLDGRRERPIADEVEIGYNRYRLGGGRFQYRPKRSRDGD